MKVLAKPLVVGEHMGGIKLDRLGDCEHREDDWRIGELGDWGILI
jgi:hypothetical protein